MSIDLTEHTNARVDLLDGQQSIAKDQRHTHVCSFRVRCQRIDAYAAVATDLDDRADALGWQRRQCGHQMKPGAVPLNLRRSTQMCVKTVDQRRATVTITALHAANVSIVVTGGQQVAERTLDENRASTISQPFALRGRSDKGSREDQVSQSARREE